MSNSNLELYREVLSAARGIVSPHLIEKLKGLPHLQLSCAGQDYSITMSDGLYRYGTEPSEGALQFCLVGGTRSVLVELYEEDMSIFIHNPAMYMNICDTLALVEKLQDNSTQLLFNLMYDNEGGNLVPRPTLSLACVADDLITPLSTTSLKAIASKERCVYRTQPSTEPEFLGQILVFAVNNGRVDRFRYIPDQLRLTLVDTTFLKAQLPDSLVRNPNVESVTYEEHMGMLDLVGAHTDDVPRIRTSEDMLVYVHAHIFEPVDDWFLEDIRKYFTVNPLNWGNSFQGPSIIWVQPTIAATGDVDGVPGYLSIVCGGYTYHVHINDDNTLRVKSAILIDKVIGYLGLEILNNPDYKQLIELLEQRASYKLSAIDLAVHGYALWEKVKDDVPYLDDPTHPIGTRHAIYELAYHRTETRTHIAFHMDTLVEIYVVDHNLKVMIYEDTVSCMSLPVPTSWPEDNPYPEEEQVEA